MKLFITSSSSSGWFTLTCNSFHFNYPQRSGTEPTHWVSCSCIVIVIFCPARKNLLVSCLLTLLCHPSYTEDTIYVSDITAQDTPVGVDFYWAGEKGEQFGPFGVLYPWSNETGRGYFRCSEPAASTKTESRYLEGRSIFHDKHPHLLRHKLKKP